MAGLDPAIHHSSQDVFRKGWMRGSSPRMTSRHIDLPAKADHLGRAELLPDPARAGEQARVVMALGNQLDADRQAVGAAMGRQGQRRGMEDGPDRLEARIAGLAEAARRLAVGAWGQQHIDAVENLAEPRPAVFAEPQGREVFAVRHRAPDLDALAQALADRLAMAVPFVAHRGRALIVVDGLARGVAQP